MSKLFFNPKTGKRRKKTPPPKNTQEPNTNIQPPTKGQKKKEKEGLFASYQAFVGNVLNEVAPAPAAPAPATTTVASTPAATTNTDENTKQQSKLVNLKPDQLKKNLDQTHKRIEELKGQFNNEVATVVKKLSANPNYKPKSIEQFGEVIKNEFLAYVYDKWITTYTELGNNEKITELTKVKKENEVTLKQNMDNLNNMISEKTAEIAITNGGNYNYHSTTLNQDIQVKVLGERGQMDGKDVPEHANDYYVENSKSKKRFWVTATALKPNKPKAPVSNTNNQQAPAPVVPTQSGGGPAPKQPVENPGTK